MQTLETAPAKSKDMAVRLAERWEQDTDLVTLMDGVIRAGLVSTTERWDITTKKFVERPDTKSQLEAVKLILAYSAGLPLARSVTIAIESGGYGAMKEALRESPELLAAVERELDKAKFHGRHLKKAEPAAAIEELPPA